MFTKFHLKFLWIFLFAFASVFSFGLKTEAKTIIDQDISVDTTWTKENSPYIIDKTIAVFDDATLNIEAGVEIKFTKSNNNNLKSIYVFGKVNATGSLDEGIYFTSNVDDYLSNTDDEEFCDEEYDEEGNIISKTNCEYFDFDEPNNKDWGGLYFIDSDDSVLENVVFSYGDSPLVFQNSSASLKHFLIQNSFGGILAYSNSTLSLLDGGFEYLEQDALVLYNETLINFSNLYFENIINNPINVYNNSSLSGNYFDFFGSFLSPNTEAILVFNSSNLVLNNAKFFDCPSNSCITFFDNYETTEVSLIDIKNSLFFGGEGSGLLSFSSTPILAKVENSVFFDFDYFAIEIYNDSVEIDARNNFWGDASGPLHENSNLLGLGEIIYGDNVYFDPWLLSNPFDVCEVDCVSNILFLPGMQGSRLYGDLGKGEKELWFSRNDSFQEALFLDENGKSINDIYTKNDTKNTGEARETGVIDEATILNIKIYNALVSELRNLKTSKIINDYSLIPYDWRLSLDEIINNGQVFGNQDRNLSYLEPQIFEESFIYKQLSDLAKSSKNGKVSIIAHSNGGLVTKALIEKLKDNNDPLYEKIDKVFLVAVPQIGTPEAVLALLFGTGVGPLNAVMDQDISRAFGENMPTLYNLLPRQSYFESVDNNDSKNSIINFTKSKSLEKELEFYGNSINNFEELQNYIKGAEGRIDPDIYDIKKSNVGNSYLYNKALEVYNFLDNWTPHQNTKIIQVGGWGMETVLGLDFKEYVRSFTNKTLSYKLRKVVDGDGTVVIPSSLYMSEGENVERWYVDLDEVNDDKVINLLPIKHASILEVKSLLNFIKNKIQNLDYSDPENIIVKNKPISNKKNLEYTLHSPLYLGVFDSLGRFTGRNQDGEFIDEIPEVDFFQIGEVQNLSIPIDFPHTLMLYGYDEGSFSLDLDEFLNNEYFSNQLFEGISNTDKTVAKIVYENEESLNDIKLLLDLEGDGDFEETYYPFKETPIVPIVETINNPGVVLINQNNNQIVNNENIGEVLGESIELVEDINDFVLEDKIENKIILETVENTEIKQDNNIKKELNNNIVEEEKINNENQNIAEIVVNTEKQEKNSSPKPILIFTIIVILLISFKYLFKIL